MINEKMPEPAYQITNLTRSYNGRTVLSVDQLEIYRAQVHALVGPSGAGKSTLLRLLNFLEKPSQGVVRYKEHEFSLSAEMPMALRRQVTTVFQHPILLDRSVQDNIAYGMRLRGEKNYAERVAEMMRRFGLNSLAQQRVRTLSGGEAQRVALARALVIKPEVLLLDEPTANLDPYNVGLIEEVIAAFNQENQATVIWVTHNVFQAKRTAQRVSFLLDGQIVETSDVVSFFENSSDPRTTAFVRGKMVY
jgi:tungstate transport system ATP-binding protein